MSTNLNQSDTHVAVRGLAVGYESREGVFEALRDITFEVSRGEFVSLVGASGCGKTTLLRIVGGLLSPADGVIEIDGAPPGEAQARKAIGFVFQDPSLLPWLDVEQNVLLATEVNQAKEANPGAAQLVELVGLGDFRHYHPGQLSGGMKQRVSIARALAVEPELLLLDEPLGSLDEITRAAMRYEILRLWEHTNPTALMVTHSITEAVAMSDRVLVMHGPPGRIAGAVSIDLPRPREAGIERTESFLGCVDRVQRLLTLGVMRGRAA